MAEAATSVAKTQSWRPLFWGLAALLLAPVLPLFEAIIPVQQTLLLLVLVVAACSIVGWKLGGRLALALIWVALSIWMLLQPAGPPGSQYDQMTRGWAILLAASFGLVSLWSTTMPFFSRALFALGLSVGVGFVIALSSPSGIARFQRAADEELTRRVSITIQKVEEGRNTPEWQQMAARVPMVDTWNEDSEAMMRLMPKRERVIRLTCERSLQFAAIAVLMGIRYVPAAAVGGFFLGFMPVLLTRLSHAVHYEIKYDWFQVILGALLIAQLILLPDGVWGDVRKNASHAWQAIERGAKLKRAEARPT